MTNKYKLTRAEMNAMLRDLRKVYDQNNEVEFMKILRRLEISDEDPRFPAIVKFFRDLKSGKV